MSRRHRRIDPAAGGFFALALALGFLFAYPIPTLTLLALVTFYFVMSARSKRKAEAEKVRLAKAHVETWAAEARAMSRPAPGADWCDHCAEWTVHETEHHQERQMQ